MQKRPIAGGGRPPLGQDGFEEQTLAEGDVLKKLRRIRKATKMLQEKLAMERAALDDHRFRSRSTYSMPPPVVQQSSALALPTRHPGYVPLPYYSSMLPPYFYQHPQQVIVLQHPTSIGPYGYSLCSLPPSSSTYINPYYTPAPSYFSQLNDVDLACQAELRNTETQLNSLKKMDKVCSGYDGRIVERRVRRRIRRRIYYDDNNE